MKRLRSTDDLGSCNDKNAPKDPPLPDRPPSSSHRSFFPKSFSGNSFPRKASISPSRFDHDRLPFLPPDDVPYSRALSRRRFDRDFDGGFDSRRKDPDSRYREDRLYRSESACFSRRDFPKGFRSERERPRRERSLSSWRRFGGRVKEFGGEERERGGVACLRLRDVERERERERDRLVKSPSWSRDSGSDQSRMKAGFCGESKDSRDSRTSRSKSKSLASPTWSKDSGSEQSKSVGNVVKKSEEEVQGRSGGCSSEMEEGELEPDPQPESTAAPSILRNKGEEAVGLTPDPKDAEIESSCRESGRYAESDDNIREATTVNHDWETDRHVDDAEVSVDRKSVEKGEDEGKQVIEPHVTAASENDAAAANASENDTGDDRGTASKTEILDIIDDKGEKEEENREIHGPESEERTHFVAAERFHTEEELRLDKGCCLDVKEKEVEPRKCAEEAAEVNGRAGECLNMVSDCSDQKCIDKGKSVVVTPTHFLDYTGNGALTEHESVNLAGRNCDGDDNLEGPSIRGFELFSSSPIRKSDKCEQPGVNKPKDEKLFLEPLDLSLSLPDVLLPIGGQDANPPPGSPGCSRSVRSLTNTICTNSDGFTMSMSFSGSQSFQHNPSCSLNHNAGDNEQSVHSRPIFQGVDWQALSHNDSRNKENPVCQRVVENGNGSIRPQAFKGIASSGQVAEGRFRLAEGSSKAANGLEKQLSFQKCVEVRSPLPSTGSYENGSHYGFENHVMEAKEMFGGSMSWMSSLKSSGCDFVETVIWHILSEPMHVTAKRFHEMPVRYLSSLKESIRQMMLNRDKRLQLCTLQDVLSRTDVTVEMLRKCHRAHLEILVALKTGRPEFFQLASSIPSSELAEIFMQLRCKNLTCRSLVPVDECDCRVCSRKDGFCSTCMCLLCSNFDMASNTCSWVGCDVCLHWCHTDCGLRESYIRNGNCASGAQGMTEMQFHCAACDHPSEMFGFVKEVFQNFAREWKFERFCKELEYVKRIFSASDDFRGRRVHEAAHLMLERLTNKSIDLSEACNQILAFLSDCDSSNLGEGTLSFRKEQSKGSHETGGPSEEASWLRAVYSDKPRQLERSSSVLNVFQRERQTEICPAGVEIPMFEELESIVRIKQAEAEMFQARADDARREAEGLRRIAVAKNEKVEEEYMSRIVKLSLGEAEEMRRKKYEELQALERAHRDYFDLKMRMEEEIRGLLLKMEATKQSLAL